MKKYNLLIISTLFIFNACHRAPHFTVEGTIAAVGGDTLYLEQVTDSAVKTLDLNKQYALKSEDKAKLMGFEGIASHAYFEVLPKLWTEGAELCI